VTTVICIDAKSKRGRETGLRFLRRYEVIAEDDPAPCLYCNSTCEKIAVVSGVGMWCRKRFAFSERELATVTMSEYE
jgi:hypothetical protein